MHRWILLAALVVAGSAQAQAPAAVTQPLAEPVVETAPLYSFSSEGAEARQRSLARLAPKVTVERQATTPQACAQSIQAALDTGAYQVFVERQGQAPALAPLQFSMTFRDKVDPVRIRPVCQIATGLVIAKLPEVLKSSDAQTRHDYIVALTLADWAQAKAENKPPLGSDFPSDVTADPLGVMARGR